MREMPGLFTLTDADLPAMKRAFVCMMTNGAPLILLPAIARAAEAKGFVEGVHFIVSRPLPTF